MVRKSPLMLASIASLPILGAWIEIYKECTKRKYYQSLPILGAWIEINNDENKQIGVDVAPYTGSVD